jgi:hypothetical protein
MIARGLRRQGLPELAEQIENRLVNVANILGGNYEFIVVDDAGRIVDPRREQRSTDLPVGWSAALPVEMVPEQTLAWSVTAALRIKRERASRCARARDVDTRHVDEVAGGAYADGAYARGAAADGLQEPWLTALAAEVLAGTRNVPMYRTRQELIDARAALSSAHLAHLSGLLRSAGTVAVQGFADVMPRAYGRRLWRRLEAITQPARGARRSRSSRPANDAATVR